MKLKYTGCLPAAALAMVFAPASFAQDRLAPVIVTAPGPDRSADELIGNATAIDRDEILERLAGSLGDTLDREPGVATTFFGQGASRPVLRGLGAERVQVLTNGIGVIDASAASPDHQVAADGIDATNIEILRGPAALAYGGQAIGGVVNVIDGLIVEDLPEEAASGDLFGAWNSVNEGSELGGHGQLVAGPLVFSLSASRRDFDDFDIPGMAESSLFHALEEAEEEEHEEDEDHEEEEGEDHDHEEEEHIEGTLPNSFLETETLAAGLSWVGDNGFFGVAVRRQTAEYGLPGHSHEHGHEDEDHEDEEHEGEEEDHEEEEHDHEEEMPFIDLEQTRIDIRGGITLDTGFLTDITGTLAIADYEHTEFEAPGEAGTVYETDGVEGRLEFGHMLGEVQGTAGLQFLDKDFAAFGEEALISPTTNQTISLFVYETREWESGLGLEGGLRLEQAELDNVDFGTAEFDLISGSAGLHKHFDGGWFLGAQIAHTERAPNETELFADGPHLATGQYERGNPDLDTERGLNLEGTARWRGDAASFGINLFATNFSDFIYLTPGVVLVDGAETDEVDELPVFLFAQ
ncbi:MAG: TonB-dependent receptor, partial [Hyphomonadaceae bacterium]|nr:TonB-dependent receptor [Hyphomonadaceae bacterium]